MSEEPLKPIPFEPENPLHVDSEYDNTVKLHWTDVPNKRWLHILIINYRQHHETDHGQGKYRNHFIFFLAPTEDVADMGDYGLLSIPERSWEMLGGLYNLQWLGF